MAMRHLRQDFCDDLRLIALAAFAIIFFGGLGWLFYLKAREGRLRLISAGALPAIILAALAALAAKRRRR